MKWCKKCKCDVGPVEAACISCDHKKDWIEESEKSWELLDKLGKFFLIGCGFFIIFGIAILSVME